MFKLIKDGQIKYQTTDKFLKELIAEGWEIEGEYERKIVKKDTSVQYEDFHTEASRQELLEKARELGLNPHHKLGVAKLREMIDGNR